MISDVSRDLNELFVAWHEYSEIFAQIFCIVADLQAEGE